MVKDSDYVLCCACLNYRALGTLGKDVFSKISLLNC
jgi:hypothetical protein